MILWLFSIVKRKVCVVFDVLFYTNLFLKKNRLFLFRHSQIIHKHSVLIALQGVQPQLFYVSVHVLKSSRWISNIHFFGFLFVFCFNTIQLLHTKFVFKSLHVIQSKDSNVILHILKIFVLQFFHSIQISMSPFVFSCSKTTKKFQLFGLKPILLIYRLWQDFSGLRSF